MTKPRKHPPYDAAEISEDLMRRFRKSLEVADLVILKEGETREEGHFRPCELHTKRLTIGEVMVLEGLLMAAHMMRKS